MPIYRASLNYPMLFVFFLWVASLSFNLLISQLLYYVLMAMLLLISAEGFRGGLRMKNCLRFITRKGYEIHVSDEAKRDPELYLKLVASKLLIALKSNQPVYIVAHSNREKMLLSSIPNVICKDADFMVKLSHFVGVSIYNKETGGRQNLRFIKRYRDVKKRWDYGCTHFEIPVSEEAINYLESLNLNTPVKKANFFELFILSIFFLATILLIVVGF